MESGFASSRAGGKASTADALLALAPRLQAAPADIHLVEQRPPSDLNFGIGTAGAAHRKPARPPSAAPAATMQEAGGAGAGRGQPAVVAHRPDPGRRRRAH